MGTVWCKRSSMSIRAHRQPLAIPQTPPPPEPPEHDPSSRHKHAHRVRLADKPSARPTCMTLAARATESDCHKQCTSMQHAPGSISELTRPKHDPRRAEQLLGPEPHRTAVRLSKALARRAVHKAALFSAGMSGMPGTGLSGRRPGPGRRLPGKRGEHGSARPWPGMAAALSCSLALVAR